MPKTMTRPTDMRPCVRCGTAVRNRRALVPKFCPECGQRLGPSPAEYPHEAGPRRADGAMSSLILGIFSLCAPPLGALLGLFAMIVGYGAKREIDDSHGRLNGGGLALTGICLGFFGFAFSIGYCSGL